MASSRPTSAATSRRRSCAPSCSGGWRTPSTWRPGRRRSSAIVERLVAVLQGRFPDLADLGRDVQYRYIEQPAFERVRGSVQADMLGPARPARAGARAGARPTRLRRDLVECPQPLRSVIAAELEAFAAPVRLTALEVLLRRDYRFRALDRVQRRPGHRSRPWCWRPTRSTGRRWTSCRTCAPAGGHRRAPERVARGAGRAARPSTTRSSTSTRGRRRPVENADALAASLADRLEAAGFERPLRRRRGHRGAAARRAAAAVPLQFFTFRPFGPGYREDKLYRGLHPMLGKRLHVWRLQELLPRAAAVGRGRLPVPRRGAGERARRAASSRWPRSATVTPLPRRERPGRRHPAPRADGARGADGDPPRAAAAEGRRPPALEPRDALRAAAAAVDRAGHRSGGAADREPGRRARAREGSSIRAEMPDDAGRAARHGRVDRDGRRPGAGAAASSPPPTEPLRRCPTTTRRSCGCGSAGLTYPYEIIRMLTPEHAGAPTADIAAGRRSSSTTSTRRARSCR